jgi:hypothetical protein
VLESLGLLHREFAQGRAANERIAALNFLYNGIREGATSGDGVEETGNVLDQLGGAMREQQYDSFAIQ